MFVNAPRRTSIGTTSVSSNKSARRSSGPSYGSASEAMAHAMDFTSTASVLTGQASRAIMQRGIVGPNRYIDTDYSASYFGQKFSGHEKLVWRNTSTGQFQSESYPLSYGASGFFSTGIASYPTSIASPTGSGGGAIGVYNRLVIANLQNRIKTEVSVKTQDNDFDGGEALSGLAPSVKMVAERAVQVLRAWNAVRTRNYQKAADVLGLRRKFITHSPADVWLEMQYGWLPLLNDIFGGTEKIIDLLDSSNDKAEKFYTVTRKGREGLIVLPAVNSTGFSKLEQTCSGYVTVEAKLRYTIGDSFVAYMSSLRLNNPVYIAWTAVPYSFVVDWLIPVGSMLSALSAPLGLKFKGGYMTTRCYSSAMATASGHSPGLGYPVVLRSGSASAELETVWISRTGFTTWPGPALYVRFPIRSIERAASAVSLIATTKRYR